jgi:hypothetical protein
MMLKSFAAFILVILLALAVPVLAQISIEIEPIPLPEPDKIVTDYSKVETANLIALQKFFSEQKVEIFVGGTEYTRGIDTQGKVFASIVAGNVSLDNSNCIVSVYYPDNSGKFLSDAYMTFIEKGIYYRDFPVASDMQLGVYPLIVECYFPVNNIFFNATAYHVYNGTYTSGSVADTAAYDGISLRFTEALYATGVRTVNVTLNMSANTTNLTERVTIEFGGEWNGGAGAAGEDVKMSAFNFTGNKWADLPNHVTDAAPQSPVNVANILPRPFSDFFNGSTVAIKFEDVPVGTDGSNSILYIDRLQIDVLNNATLISCTARGTSELHVSDSFALAEKIWLQFLTLGTPPLLGHVSLSCLDSMTLQKDNTFMIAGPDGNKSYTKSEQEYCPYGCDPKNNQCVPSSVDRTWMIVAIIAGVLFMIFVVRRYL